MGEILLGQEKNAEAADLFKKAYNLCGCDPEKRQLISENLKKAEAAIEKVMIDLYISSLTTLWDDAWSFEREKNPQKARAFFSKILDDVTSLMAKFPNCTKFLEIHNNTSLKIDGNSIFNEGINSKSKVRS